MEIIGPGSQTDLSETPSYSGLLKAIRAGQVKELKLLPRTDQVLVQFKDGSESRVAVFSNDQQILRSAEAARVPLSVSNTNDASSSGLLVNLFLGVLLISLLVLLLKAGLAAAKAQCFLGYGCRTLQQQHQCSFRRCGWH